MEGFPTFIDVEASSLGSRSYPIEIGWNTPEGTIETYCISPAGITRWTDWSMQAEQLHGLTRAVLHREGKTPSWVARHLHQQLAGHIVYSDDPEYDRMWLAELYAVSYSEGPRFAILSVDALLIRLLCPNGGYVPGWARLAALKHRARQVVGRQHRAAWDVQYLLTLYGLVQAQRQGGPAGR